jgi:hypothetical protein
MRILAGSQAGKSHIADYLIAQALRSGKNVVIIRSKPKDKGLFMFATIYDVLRRLLESKPMTETEIAVAHKVIADHEAANTPGVAQPEGEAPEPDSAPATGEGE